MVIAVKTDVLTENSELLKVTANRTNEMATKLEGEIALRLAAQGGLDIMGATAALDRLRVSALNPNGERPIPT